MPQTVDPGGALLSGRYVRLEFGLDWLQLAEVEVLGQPLATSTNLALGRCAFVVSSGAYYSENQDACDGIVDGDFFHGSVFHSTSNGPGQFWEVDLGAERAIDRIVVWPRTDNGVWTRTAGITVKVLSASRAALYTSTPLLGSAVPQSIDLGTALLAGRYVRVELNSEWLQLAEVEVLAASPPESTNLAAGRCAFANSSGAYYSENRDACDGLADGDFFHGSVFHSTYSGFGQFWEVDLGSEQAIDRIVVWPRTDNGTWTRTAGTIVKILDSSRAAVYNPAPLLGSAVPQTIDPGVAPVTGRFVRVEHNSEWLQLAEVEVFGQTAGVVVVNSSLANASFEKGPANALDAWTLCGTTGDSVLTPTIQTFADGTRSAKLDVFAAGDRAACSEAVAAQAGTSYQLSLKLSAGAGKVGSVRVQELDGVGAVLADRLVASSSGSGLPWETVSGVFTTGPSTARLKVLLRGEAVGTYYWDMAELRPTPLAAAATDLLNSSFESGSPAPIESWALCQFSGSASATVVADEAAFHGAQVARTIVVEPGNVGLCSAAVAVAPGTGYRVAAQLLAPTDRSAGLRVIEMDASRRVVADRMFPAGFGEGDLWQRLESAFVTSPSTATVEVRLMHNAPGSSGEFRWDLIDLRPDRISALAVTTAPLNPEFESGGSPPIGWEAAYGIAPTIPRGTALLSYAAGAGRDGATALQVDVAEAGDVGACSSLIPVSDGTNYRVSAWLKTDRQTQGELRVQEYGPDPTRALLEEKALDASTGITLAWELMDGFFTPAPGTALARICLMSKAAEVAYAGQFLWDSVAFEANTAAAWARWDRDITSSASSTYSKRGGNPYADLTLTTAFWSRSTSGSCAAGPPQPCLEPSCLTGAGYWDGQASSGRDRFGFRTAVPQGNWCWRTQCAGTSGGLNCAGDPALNRTAATSTAVGGPPPSPTGTSALYLRGFLKATSRAATDPPVRNLVHADGVTPFRWFADTAWRAPRDYAKNNANRLLWRNFVKDRKTKKFTVVLVGPAASYTATGEVEEVAPAFERVLDWPNPTPNAQSRWRSSYWRQFDAFVKDANDAGIVVALVGLNDPLERSGKNNHFDFAQSYPGTGAVRSFVRNLAGRMAGSHVVYSPGFDDRKEYSTVDGVTVHGVFDQIGPQLVSQAPRHLVALHLGGGTADADYDTFADRTWLDFQLYQSGHGSNAPAPCALADNSEAANCRSAMLTKRMYDLSGTRQRPAVNGEGLYEDFGAAANPQDNREGARQTAYYTALAGSFGHTIGVGGIYHWDNPRRYDDAYNGNQSQADNDLARMETVLGAGPWVSLTPRQNLVPTQEESWARKIYIAQSADRVAVYRPGLANVDQDRRASIKQAGINYCETSWSKRWFDPTGELGFQSALCTALASPARYEFSGRPLCPPGNSPPCDWTLVLSKGSTPPPQPSGLVTGPLALDNLEVWLVADESLGTAAVAAQRVTDGGERVGEPFVVSPPLENVAQTSPFAARDMDGNFLVLWDIDRADEAQADIYGRWYTNAGEALGAAFRVNTFTPGQQVRPQAAADNSGSVWVTWMSVGQDGDRGGIYAQRFLFRAAAGSEFPVNPDGTGHQFGQLVASDGGSNVFAAWTDLGAGGQRVLVRRFFMDGSGADQPWVAEVQPPPAGSGWVAVPTGDEVLSLEAGEFGYVTLQWSQTSEQGETLEDARQTFDAQGNPVAGGL